VPHLDPDRLVLLALSEDVADDTEAGHLAACSGCRAEIDQLKQVAELGAETQGLVDLPPPPARVWAGIAAAALGARQTHTEVRDPGPPKRIGRRLLAPLLAAAAAAILAIAGTVTVIRVIDRPPAAEVTARATLTPLDPAPPAARGSAEVLDGDELRIQVANLPLTRGYYEVWLIDPDDIAKMQSLGGLPARAGAVLPIPPGTDLNTYRLVDVSAEAHDGNSAHSGDSLLRGTLTN
jgi:hypothetical protein